MWSDVFLTKSERTGEKLAIVIIDTQGLFDNETSPMDNSRIFALGTLISSIQILNLSGMIQEDQLQYLQFATEFAKFAAADSGTAVGKPFQHLMFLIRDWSSPDDYKFGFEGGAEYLKEVLTIKNARKDELKTVRQFINSSFEELDCYLLPHPGNKLATRKTDGHWGLMEDDFKEFLVLLIEKLLGADNLVCKQINAKDLKGFEMNDYLKIYLKQFQSDQLPQPKTIYESTVEKQMSLMVTRCVDSYKENIYKNQDIIESERDVRILHDLNKTKTINMFMSEKKMGNKAHEATFQKQLEADIDKLYSEWEERSLKSLAKLEEERRKTEAAIEEKKKLEQEAVESEREAKLKQAELERMQKQKEIDDQERFEYDQKMNESRVQAEAARAKELEAIKRADKALRDHAIQQMETARLQADNERKDAELRALKNRPTGGGGGGCAIL